MQITQSFTFVPELTTAELEKIKKQQQGKLTALQLKEAEMLKQQDKEDAELARKQAEINALEKQITEMKKQTADGGGDLDQMLAIVREKKKQKIKLEEMRKKAEADRKRREKEIADMKKQKFDENIAKYNEIANSEFGQDMKGAAWNSVLKNLGIAKNSIKIGNLEALKMKFYDLPTQIIDSRDGKTYKLVYIGNQVWFKQNLAYNAGSGCWAYDNSQSNVTKYGYLYNWQTAKTVCPTGWHLPSDTEWAELENQLGGRDVAGKKLKTVTGWNLYKGENYGNNESGFSALPGGYRGSHGSFSFIGRTGYWWSSTPNGSEKAWKRYLDYDYGGVYRYHDTRTRGCSVRCLED